MEIFKELFWWFVHGFTGCDNEDMVDYRGYKKCNKCGRIEFTFNQYL